MGGKALKNTFTRRYEKAEFFKLAEELVPKIRSIFVTEAEVIQAYKAKDTFGDMDILVLSEPGNPHLSDIRGLILEHFGTEISPIEIHHNGNCWSFAHQELQIDLILTPRENWIPSQVFFSFNDLGKFMGKIYHKFGLKYGYDGLKMPYNFEGKKVGTIQISKDMEKIFEFIGCPWKKFQDGFENLEEIFQYVINSSYFDYTAFQMENLNSINKNRNKRRKVYTEFLQYLKDHNITKTNDWAEDKSTYWKEINTYFPEANLLENIKKLEKKENLRQELATKFNGNLVMEKFPKLQGPALGKAIGLFQNKFANFDEFITDHTSEEIMTEFEKSIK